MMIYFWFIMFSIFEQIWVVWKYGSVSDMKILVRKLSGIVETSVTSSIGWDLRDY